MAIDGNYNITIDSPMGNIEVKLALKATGNVLSGSADSTFGGKNEFTGKVNGDEVSWGSAIDGPMGKMKLSFKGAIKGSDFSGEVNTGAFGTYPFKGKKV